MIKILDLFTGCTVRSYMDGALHIEASNGYMLNINETDEPDQFHISWFHGDTISPILTEIATLKDIGFISSIIHTNITDMRIPRYMYERISNRKY